MTERDNFSKLNSNNAHEKWYIRYRAVVEDIVHQVYTKDVTYRKLQTRIDPSLAFAVSALTAGCSADTSVSADTK